MKIGIIGPSKIREESLVEEVARIIAESGNEVFLTSDKGSTSELFAQKFLDAGGKKVFIIAPLDDNEFGNDWLNLDLGEVINCGTWRNQPEKLNEETDVLICLGYSAGGLAEMAYTKWFNKKAIYVIQEFVSQEMPKEVGLDFKYISIKDLKGELSNAK